MQYPHITHAHEKRIVALEAAMQKHQQRLDAGAATMQQLRNDLKTNTDATVANTATSNAIKSDTGEIIEFFDSVKGAFKVFDMIGKAAKPLAAIVALGVAVWGAVQAFASGSHIK